MSFVGFRYVKLEYEAPPAGHWDGNHNTKYVKWDSVPEHIKRGILNRVAGWITKQAAQIKTHSEIYIPAFTEVIHTTVFGSLGPQNVVLMSHAIRDYIRNNKGVIPTPYYLTSNGRGWFIHFVQK